MGFDVARSTVLGNAKASIRGTSNKEIPRLSVLFNYLPWGIGGVERARKLWHRRIIKVGNTCLMKVVNFLMSV